MTLTHGLKCAHSPAPARNCRCSCNGALHGSRARPAQVVHRRRTPAGRSPRTPTSLIAATTAKGELSELNAQSRSVDIAEVAAWLIDNVNWTDGELDAVQRIRESVREHMASTLVNQLDELDSFRVKLGGTLTDASQADHLLCSLIVIVLDVHDKGKDVMRAAVHTLARTIVLSLDISPTASFIAQAVLAKVLQAGADVLWESVINTEAIDLIRFIGMDCPDWDVHSDHAIFKLCAGPLLKKRLLETDMD